MTKVVRLSFRSRVVSGTVALALAFVTAATCFAGTLRATAQSHDASCHGMQTEGSGANVVTLGAAADCCAVQHAILGLGGAADTLGPAPSIALIAASAPLLRPAYDSRPRISSSPPTYLLISVFRI